ncbi:MAG: hypothetical protein K2X47_05450 [Bdellovibrionales bacterium]|nr:hypothetical protein [Bdellovibrionales bacterium]
MKIKIRYNTDKDKSDSSLPPWRVLINGEEHLAQRVLLETRSWTTLDEVEPGRLKWHISCDGVVDWNAQNGECIIREERTSEGVESI